MKILVTIFLDILVNIFDCKILCAPFVSFVLFVVEFKFIINYKSLRNTTTKLTKGTKDSQRMFEA